MSKIKLLVAIPVVLVLGVLLILGYQHANQPFRDFTMSEKKLVKARWIETTDYKLKVVGVKEEKHKKAGELAWSNLIVSVLIENKKHQNIRSQLLGEIFLSSEKASSGQALDILNEDGHSAVFKFGKAIPCQIIFETPSRDVTDLTKVWMTVMQNKGHQYTKYVYHF
ncbi:hypothetical protein ACSMFR_03120 [Listeria aquatica]|uniref:hypothetical protein n=1 Tax=Listeria aquatica TaxID=1494960 RepID=UPI003F7158F8